MLIQGTQCPGLWANTGTSDCSFRLDQLEGVLIVANSKAYDMSTYANYAAFLSDLQADAIAALPANRLYPVFHVDGVTDNTADANIQESAFGKVKDVSHAQVRWTVNMSDYGLRALANIDVFRHNTKISVYPVFKGGLGNSSIATWKLSDGKNYGARARVYTSKAAISSGVNMTENQFMIAFDDEDIFFNRNIEFIPTPEGQKLSRVLHGVHDLTLKVYSATTSAIEVGVVDAASGAIMGETYELALEQAGWWMLNLTSTGATVTIQSVTWSNITKRFTLAGNFTTAEHLLGSVDPTAAAALTVPFGNGITGGFYAAPVYVTPA